MKSDKTSRKAGGAVTQAPRSRQALLVLGMHRSGTSALAGVLAKLGATPPLSPMPGNEFNPKGYWESQPLAMLHDRILGSAGSSWSDWGKFNPDWYRSPGFQGFERQLEEQIHKEYGDSPFFLVKDPRMSRFLPLWLGVLGNLGVVPKTIILVRHPDEVIHSLKRRDRFGPLKSRLIWLRHVLDAEVASRGLPRVFVHYEDLLADWRLQVRRIGEKIGVHWPRSSAQSSVEISDFLSSELRHHRAAHVGVVDRGVIEKWAHEVHRILAGFARGEPEGKSALTALDSIRDELDEASDIYGPIVQEAVFSAEQEYSRAKARLDVEADAAQRKFAELEAELIDMERRAVRAETDARSRAGRLLALQGEKDKLEADAAACLERHLKQEAEQARQLDVANLERSQLDNQLKEMRSELRDLKESWKADRDRLVEARNELEASRGESNHRNSELKAQSQRVSQLEEELVRLNASLSERFRELAAFAVAMESTRSELAATNSRLEALQAERDGLLQVRTKLKDTQALLARQRARFDSEKEAMDSRVVALESQLESIEEAYEGILNSNTWKMGRPFRVLRRLLSGKDVRPIPVSAEDIESIRAAGVFDEAWYLDRYPDVASQGMDPIHHYLVHGCHEGRDPSPEFSTDAYYRAHPKIASKRRNALLDFLSRDADQ